MTTHSLPAPAALPLPGTTGRTGLTWILLALAAGAFVMGTSEFLMMGILPQIAASLGVTVGAAGRLVTTFALGIATGAPLLTAWTARIERRRLLMAAAGVFALLNLVVALVPNYGVLMVVRYLAGAVAGLFYAVSFATGASLAPADGKGRAIAFMFSGVTLATVMGSPLGAWLAQSFRWQLPFEVIAAISVMAVLALRQVLPRVPGGSASAFGQLLAVFKQPVLLWTLAAIAIVNTAWFTLYTYITPWMNSVAGIDIAWVPSVLLAYGLFSAAGNTLGGRLADRAPGATVAGSVVAQGALLLALGLAAAWVAPTLVMLMLWGASAWVFVAAIQTRIVKLAGPLADTASSLSVSAFNVGNAAGALLGGAVVQTAGLQQLNPVAAAVALLGLGALWMGRHLARKADAPAQYIPE